MRSRQEEAGSPELDLLSGTFIIYLKMGVDREAQEGFWEPEICQIERR